MRASVPGIGRPEETLRVVYEGRTVEARAGDTLAAALVDAGCRALREAGDGTRRGLFCGMGACHECEAVVDGSAGRLTCMIEVEDGMTVRRQPANPAPSDPQPSGPGARRSVELAPSVLVLGGGPAGLSAAAVIAEAGVDVVLLDERSKLGGQFYKQPGPGREIDEGGLDGQYRAGRELAGRAADAGVAVISGATVWGALRPELLLARGGECSWILRPRRLVLATGAHERAVPIPGWTLPGVMTTGAAQTLLRSSQVAPGERVLLSGNGPLNLQVAAELVRAGAAVAALVEQADLRWWTNPAAGAGLFLSAPGLAARGFSYRAALARARTPVLDRSSVVEIRGSEKVESAVVAPLDPAGGRLPGPEREIEADAVCLGYGFVPANEIPRALGCRHHIDPESGSLVVARTRTGRTSIPSVWVVGDAGGVEGAYAARALASMAAAEVLADLGAAPADRRPSLVRRAERSRRRHLRFQRALRRLYRARPLTTQLADSGTVVCRCESVSLGEIRRAVSDGAASAGAVKRLTRAGMGKCQGRYCSPSVLALAARAVGAPPDELSGFAPQIPARPVEIAEAAAVFADL